MKAAILVTWGNPVPGREMKALEFGLEANEYWGKIAAEGKCTTPEQFISPATGHGYWIVKGEREVLFELMETDFSKKSFAKGAALLENYTTELVLTEDSVDEFLGSFASVITETT